MRAYVELWLQRKLTSRHKIFIFKMASVNKHHLLAVALVILRRRKAFFSRLCSKSPCYFCKDNRIFLNWDRKFLIVSCHFVFDLFIREAIKQNINSNVIQTGLGIFLFFSFSYLTWVSLPFPKKISRTVRIILPDVVFFNHMKVIFYSKNNLALKFIFWQISDYTLNSQ